ncbi:MAG: hypothetical protein ACI4O3_04540 [Oscillospiraceae bacterium]
MLELDRSAAAFFQTLPESSRTALERSNLTFHTIEDLQSYLEENPARVDAVLYQQLPDPAIPSNAAYDPLDSADP